MGAPDRLIGRFIAKENIEEAASWEFQSFAGATAGAGLDALLSERERRAFERGRQSGYDAGVADARKVKASFAQHIERALADLRGRFGELEAGGADKVLDLALEIAQQVVRHEIRTHREALLPVVREAVMAIVDQHAQPRIYLNPKDFALIHADLESDASFAGARFIPEASLARGGCRVETQNSNVDATIENRWRRVMDTLGVQKQPYEPDADEPEAAPSP